MGQVFQIKAQARQEPASGVRDFLFMYADGDETDLEQADLASRRSLELAPDLAEAHVVRGLVLSMQNQYQESEEAFERAIRLNPMLFEAYYFYARNSFAKCTPARCADLRRSGAPGGAPGALHGRQRPGLLG